MPPVSTVPGCAGCPLQALQPSANFVPPKAGRKDLLVIGEAAGEDEASIGEPFVGAAGRMLDGWFHKIDIPRGDLHMTNVLSCRPPGNKFPLDPKARAYMPLAAARETVEHCWTNHLQPLLRSRPWEKVYLIGSQALRRVTGKPSLFEWGGTPLAVPAIDPERRVAIATIHPRDLMRDAVMYPLIFADLKRPLEIPVEDYSIHPAPSALQLFAGRPFVVDIETNIPPTEIHLVSLSNNPTTATAIPFGGAYIPALADLFRTAKEIITQNGVQFDIPHLIRHGMPISLDPRETTVWDTMLLHHLLWPGLPHDLGTLGRQYTAKPYWKDWRGEGDEEAVYACRDADGTGEIYIKLRREIERAPRLAALYHNVQVPLARICHLMTETGIMTDPAAAAKVAAEADSVIAAQEVHLPAHMRSQPRTKRRKTAAPAGTLTPPKYGKKGQLLKQKPVKWLYETYEVTGPSPWKNGPQTAAYLYGELGLKERLNAEGKVTTGKQALAIIFATSQRPEVRAIREMRVWAHRKKICEKLMKGAARRIHASFNPHGTSTGRLSSTGGDAKIQMQNLTEDMRVVFVPSQPGWKLWSVDYSQMEARLAAWFAKDTDRAARFDIPGFNEYKMAASIFLGVPMNEVVKDKAPDSVYHRAKTIVLGTDRALGAKKISITNDIPEIEVKEMLRKWKAAIPATMAWQEATGNRAKRDACLWNPFGRRGLFYTSSAYCNDPFTPVLKSNLTWSPISSLEVGDKLIGFEEVKWGVLPRPPKIQESTVLSTRTFKAPRYRIVTDRGELICTPNHAWLVRNALSSTGETRSIERWLRTDSLGVGDGIVYFTRPWTQRNTREAGWLAGILDGEGTYAKAKRGRVYIAQKAGRIFDQAVVAAQALGFKATQYSYKENGVGNIAVDAVGDGAIWDGLEVIGSLGATRLIANARHNWENANLYANAGGNKKIATARVLAIEELAKGDVTGITTSTSTFIANGFCSHNTEGISFEPQSTGADVIYRGMIALMYERINWPLEWVKRVVQVIKPLPEPARLLLQVHDELVGECPADLIPEVRATLDLVLGQPWPELNGLALPVNFSFGDNWLEMSD